MIGAQPLVSVSLFAIAAVVSLSTSWLLVTRLERLGERIGLSEALLGMVAALAADAPEITSAITAMINREQRVGAGVIIGSNVFNIAALLGLGAVVAGRIGLHRRVVLLGGGVALWIAGVCFAAVSGMISAPVGMTLSAGMLAAYVALLGARHRDLARLPLPRRWVAWLRAALVEEERELLDAIRPVRGGPRDLAVAAAALAVVVAASAVMERAASTLGSANAVPDIVVGGLVLAVVTSLPNAVAAVYLAMRGRGAAALSTTLNSNAINVTVGLLLPGTVLGLGSPSWQTTLVVAWYVSLTVVALGLAYRDRGLRRPAGILIIGSYLAFVGWVIATA